MLLFFPSSIRGPSLTTGPSLAFGRSNAGRLSPWEAWQHPRTQEHVEPCCPVAGPRLDLWQRRAGQLPALSHQASHAASLQAQGWICGGGGRRGRGWQRRERAPGAALLGGPGPGAFFSFFRTGLPPPHLLSQPCGSGQQTLQPPSPVHYSVKSPASRAALRSSQPRNCARLLRPRSVPAGGAPAALLPAAPGAGSGTGVSTAVESAEPQTAGCLPACLSWLSEKKCCL